MKAFSIQQPWGSLICAGIKDVENRKWALKATPLTVLIHVGAKRHKIDEDTMPLIWANPIEDAQTMGIIGKINDMPTSAIIGVATIDRCEEETFLYGRRMARRGIQMGHARCKTIQRTDSEC